MTRLGLLALTAAWLAAQPGYAPPNGGLPNPYQAIGDWAKLPDGRKWGATAGVAGAPNGNVWAIDRCGTQHSCGGSSLDPIIEFNQKGQPLRKFGAGVFEDPHGIFVDPEGNAWVTDERVSEDKKHGVQVIKFSPDGKFVAVWTQFGCPSGLAIDKNDMLYGSDSQSNDKINPVSRRGICIGSVKDGKVTAFIADPEPKGITSTAEGLAVDWQGNIYGAENGSHDIRKYVKK